MKKDKEKHRLTPESTTAEEPKISSTTLALQLLTKAKEKNKEAEKKESANETAKVRCKVCFKEIAPKRLCSGHGGGGGGGGDSASSDKTSEEKARQGEDKSLTQPGKVFEITDALIDEFDSEELNLESSFAPEIIAELIDKGLLLVDSDLESKTITIKLLCEPKVLTEEQREELKKFIEAITKEFKEFKEENNLPDDCLKIIQDENGNMLSLRITMPTLALYDGFIQRLANNLVPIPSQKAQERKDVTKDQGFDPNPLSMEPKPYNYNKDKLSKPEEIDPNKDVEPKKSEEDEQKIFNRSPFNMKPW
ncbi:hypothetical protein [Legionella fallonii]|uniref:Uncharacterized protein n=1 Tax=Legionella fallonii LLAP-10 TaxID=1212491 RepID=A0A098G789_9GAMM|nr:hypothetical protein [Legionella fallonii]CEG57839.1 conserved protein of unknown function [Legionella fallonii LLAP-10]